MKRALLLILDMVAGHWAKGVRLPSTGLPPPNVHDYAREGLLPTFRDLMDQGLFAFAWNRGRCNTPHGMRYLASGSYEGEAEPSVDPYWRFREVPQAPTILSACKAAYPDGAVAAFGSDAWMQTGWWKAPDCTMGWGSYYSDFLTMQHAFSWMLAHADWRMVLIYLAQYDQTGRCPVWKEGAAYTEDKHHSLLRLDRYVWSVVTFLGESGLWDETFLCIASDHGCHVGCNVAVAEGRLSGVPEEALRNYCSNHQEPYDCSLWDFEKHEPTGTRVDGPRRTLLLIGGGALPAPCRGVTVDEAEIVDFSPTVARLMKIPFEARGRPLPCHL